MRLLIELNGQPGKARGGRIGTVRAIMILVALSALVLGCLLLVGVIYQSDPASGMSVDDDTIIRQHLREISPPRPVGVRLHNALRALAAEPSYTPDPPLVVTGLMIGPGGILLATQSHGVHVYDRQSKTWQTSDEDASASDAPVDTQPANTNAMPESADVSASPIIADLIRRRGERQYTFITNDTRSELSIGATFADAP